MFSDKCQYSSDFIGHTYAIPFYLYTFVDMLLLNH
jgi:hypothetical protein